MDQFLGGIRRDAPMRLFCFPFAGGDAHIYQTWGQRLGPGIDLCPIQLPGRGLRFGEVPEQDAQRLIARIIDEARSWIEPAYAIFGHSLGALLGYEMARQLKAFGLPEPRTLFVSGAEPPQFIADRDKIASLPDRDFIERIALKNGTPRDVLDNEELMQIFLPTLRADFHLIESYMHVAGPALTCPIVAFYGLEDPEVAPDRVQHWRQHTSGSFASHPLVGDHFFLFPNVKMITHGIQEALATAAVATPG